MRRIEPVNHGYDGSPPRKSLKFIAGDTTFSPPADEIKPFGSSGI
jgi:hypothetical protein